LRLAHATRFTHVPYTLLHYYRLRDGITRSVGRVAMLRNKWLIRQTRRALLRVGMLQLGTTGPARLTTLLATLQTTLSALGIGTSCHGIGRLSARTLSPLRNWIRSERWRALHLELPAAACDESVTDLAALLDLPFTVVLHPPWDQDQVAAHIADLGALPGCRGAFIPRRTGLAAPLRIAGAPHSAYGYSNDRYARFLLRTWTR
jgi:hypothetical protein